VLPIDPEIEVLLEFEPVPRKVKRPDGWTPELQREFIHRLALCGSPPVAVNQMGKNISGIEAIYKEKGAESFRFAWDSALELGRRRAAQREPGAGYAGRAPGLNVRGGAARGGPDDWAFEEQPPSPAQIEEAADSIRDKLLRCRRLYLQEISASSGRRAAFEVLTELPIDWDKAARGEEQADEPYIRGMASVAPHAQRKSRIQPADSNVKLPVA
jgi:hypothetical protein